MTLKKSDAALLLGFILVLSSTPTAFALPSGVLAPSQVSTHGPYLDKVLFSVITSDSSLYNALASGTIQGPEWYFTAGSFFSAKANPNLYANVTTTYSFYGIAFNMIRPVVNNTHFRRAIAYLTDYSFLQSTILAGIEGTAEPYLYDCSVYPTVCNTNVRTYPLSLMNAVKELKLAGLQEGNTSKVPLSKITWLYNGQPFSPTFYYRIDDPIRTGVAQRLVYEALQIGLQFNAKGITKAGGLIYGASLSGAISPGVYDPKTGYNTPPKFNYSAAKTTDTWDMYTFGWIVSSNFNWVWSFFNSQNVANTLDFILYYNRTMDYDTNTVNYASSLSTATNAAKKVAADFASELPYVNTMYINQLYAVYLKGWTGYADEPTTGPVETGGLYYTLLNVHPVGQYGGTFNYAIHNLPDSLDPLYSTNWVWQIDIWSEIYDTPLATPPTAFTLPLTYMKWMVSNYSVRPFSGMTGTGKGWFQMQGNQTTHKIVGGQVITFDFYKNITFTDHVPMNAYDYNFSLYIWDVSGAPTLPDSATPVAGTLSGPAGLWATYIPPNNPYEIQIYVNSSAIWNIASVIVNVLPLHIWKYFNPDQVSTASAILDTTLPFSQATSSSQCGSPCSFLAKGVTQQNAPTWLKYLPNLEVGQGPFWLRAYSGSTGSGELDKNWNYYRAPWRETAISVQQGNSYTLSTIIQEWIYNAGSSAISGVGSGQVGSVPVTNATGKVYILADGKQVVSSVPLTGGSNGQYSATIDTSKLSPGTYELFVNATYNFLGLPRFWYQASGLQVTPVSTTTTTTTTSATTTTSTSATTTTTTTSATTTTSTSATTTTTTTQAGPNYTGTILAVIVVIIIIIIVAALLARRRRGT